MLDFCILKVSVLLALARALDMPVERLLSLPERTASRLNPQLAAQVERVAALPDTPQRQVAAIIRGYLSVIPDEPS